MRLLWRWLRSVRFLISRLESVKQISAAVEQVNGVVQSNSATSEEVSATSEELSASAESLDEMVSDFVLRK